MQGNEKILFLAEGQMGDLILLTPALHALKKKFPDCRITVLLMHRRYYSAQTEPGPEIFHTRFETTSQVLLNNPDVDEILELNRNALKKLKGFKRLAAELKCIRQIRKMKFDSAVCTFPQSRLIIWSFLAGIKKRIGQKRQPFARLLTDKPDIEAKGNGVLNYYNNLLTPFGIKECSAKTHYYITKEEKTKAKLKVFNSGSVIAKKVVCIHPGASEPHKIWLPEYFAAAANYISENLSAEVIICYNSYDRDIVEEILQFAKNKISAIKLDTIRQLGAVLSLSDLCLVNNSGPRHLAAAIGLKSISLFQKHDNGEWKIYDDPNSIVIESEKDCLHCREGRCRSLIPEERKFGSHCMADIKPDIVINKIKDILQKNS